MGKTDRISRLSAGLYWAGTVLACVLPLLVVLAILRGWFDPATVLARFAQVPPGTRVTAFQGALVAGLAALSVAPMVAAFLAMRRLFGRYRVGEILTDGCAADTLRTGQALFAVAAVTVILPTVQFLVLSRNAPAGGRILSIGVEGTTLGFLLSGAVLMTIGWVMREEARAAEENRRIV